MSFTEQQQLMPVAWKETDEVECPVCKNKGFPWPKCGHITYLERTPPQHTWVGLTRDEQSFVYQNLFNATSRTDSFWVDFANAIEAKLKEKNT